MVIQKICTEIYSPVLCYCMQKTVYLHSHVLTMHCNSSKIMRQPEFIKQI